MGLLDRIAAMERRLLKVFGPAQVGRADEPPPPATGPPRCPACGRAMAEHSVDRQGNHNRVICP